MENYKRDWEEEVAKRKGIAKKRERVLQSRAETRLKDGLVAHEDTLQKNMTIGVEEKRKLLSSRVARTSIQRYDFAQKLG